MSRRHHDRVLVRAADGTRAGAASRPTGTDPVPVPTGAVPAPTDPGAEAIDPGTDGPRDFVWRGRRYTVCAVLASWQERRAWWREVGDDPGGPGGPPSPQRRVWRVEARPPSGTVGVFDLGRDDDHWLLLRSHD